MRSSRAMRFSPLGTEASHLPLRRIWVFFALTGLGVCVGVLTLLLTACAYPKLNGLYLFASYFLKPMVLLLNVLPPVLLIWLFYLLSGRAWVGFLLSFLPCVGLSLVNYFKIRLRGDPLLAADLRLVSEAGGIVGHYTLDLDWLIWFSLLCLVAGTLFARFLLPRRTGHRAARVFGAVSAAALVAVAFLSVYCNAALYQRTDNTRFINPWSDVEVFVSKGCLYSFLYSVQDMFPAPPPGYDRAAAAAVLARYPDSDIPPAQKVSVMGIMLEAFCDLTDFPALAEQPAVGQVYAPLRALEAQSVSGDLLTNIFAGGTVDSEWGFLTGSTQHNEFRSPTDSYVWYLRNQGYDTLFHHPGFSWFYNRQNVNQYLGFQDSLFTENYYGQLVDPTDAVLRSDEVLVDGILDNLPPAGPWFSFSVTYQNHGPYDSTHADTAYLSPADTGWSDETCAMLNNYLATLSNTLAAMTRLTQTLDARTDPVVLVLFGDHKPWMGNGNSAYTELGLDFDLSSEQGFRDYYSTPYLIWANSAARRVLGRDFTGAGGDCSPCFLMNKVFSLCGWEGPGFMKLANELQAVSPLIHTRNLFWQDGALTDQLPQPAAQFYRDFLCAQYLRETAPLLPPVSE